MKMMMPAGELIFFGLSVQFAGMFPVLYVQEGMPIIIGKLAIYKWIRPLRHTLEATNKNKIRGLPMLWESAPPPLAVKDR